jgi:glycosyltransferase involved in cell wall biosynthesis
MQSGGLRTKNIIKQSQENVPLITVVTVVYNGGDTLEETILSVINQTYKNIEYIIVDGASTDNTIDIIKKHEDKIDYWISEPDEGIFYAMNKGIDLATGGWINFMNSGDTFFSREVLYDLNKFITTNIDIIYGNTYLDGKLLYKPINNISNMFFLKGGMVNHQAIFARKICLKNGGFNTKYKICADKDWLMLQYKNGAKSKYISLDVCNYDTHGNSSNKHATWQDTLYCISANYGFFGFVVCVLYYIYSKLRYSLFEVRGNI